MPSLYIVFLSLQIWTAAHALRWHGVERDLEDPNVFRPDSGAGTNASADLSSLFGSPNSQTPAVNLLTLFGRAETCPYPVKCGSTWCCPSGTNCVSQVPQLRLYILSNVAFFFA